MATVSLKFIKAKAAAAATKAAAAVKVEVHMSGSAVWRTDEEVGSVTRSFSVKLKG